MHDFIVAIILGIVEGITEFLPISSTGHLIIAEQWNWIHQTTGLTEMFNVVIQVGAVLAVIPLFWERLRFMSQLHQAQSRDLLIKTLSAFVITGICGLALKHFGLKLKEDLIPIGSALLIGGLVFVILERLLRKREFKDEITWLMVVAAGLGQVVAAAFPGASRSGTTIILLLILGLGRYRATEFSFLIGIPTMLAAGLKEGWDAHKLHEAQNWPLLITTFIVSAVVAFVAVKWLLGFVRSHTFEGFGWYRILVGGTILALSLISF